MLTHRRERAAVIGYAMLRAAGRSPDAQSRTGGRVIAPTRGADLLRQGGAAGAGRRWVDTRDNVSGNRSLFGRNVLAIDAPQFKSSLGQLAIGHPESEGHWIDQSPQKR
jgi:hypothetical protein